MRNLKLSRLHLTPLWFPSSAEAQPFRVLTEQLAAYWSVLEPTFEWTTEQR
jgi:hypothetical protein